MTHPTAVQLGRPPNSKSLGSPICKRGLHLPLGSSTDLRNLVQGWLGQSRKKGLSK